MKKSVPWNLKLKSEIDCRANINGISRANVAYVLGFNPATYYRWFRKPETMPVVALKRMCEKFEIPDEKILEILKG